MRSTGLLHHLELWVPDLARAERSWGWLLTRLGAEPYQSWGHGRSWRSGDAYVVLEQSPALTSDRHDRRSPGLNHLASWVDDDFLRPRPEARGELASRERDGVLRPFAGGPAHRAAYLEDADGYEVELVAGSSGGTRKPPQPS